MKYRRTKMAALVGGCLFFASGAAYADMFGFSDVALLKQIITEVQLLTTMNSNIRTIEANIKNAGNTITGKDSWIPSPSMWQAPAAPNTFGNTSGWMNAINTGTGAPGGYSAIMQPLQRYGQAWGTYEPTMQADLARRYGLIEVTDGITANALGQSGAIRLSAAQSRAAIAKLQADQTSNDPAKNTQVGVLNIIGGLGVVQANQQTQATQALTSLVDMQAAALAAKRNEAVAEINDDINSRNSYSANVVQMHTGGSAALRTFTGQ